MMFDVGCLREVGGLMAEGRFTFSYFIPLTSAIILLTCLLQQVVIQLDYAVAKGKAFRLYRIAYFAHDP